MLLYLEKGATVLLTLTSLVLELSVISGQPSFLFASMWLMSSEEARYAHAQCPMRTDGQDSWYASASAEGGVFVPLHPAHCPVLFGR